MFNPYNNSKDKSDINRMNQDIREDWDSGQLSLYKYRIRKYLLKEFNRKCCYCGGELTPDMYPVAIEHIIPKKIVKEFTMEFMNLGLACDRCNSLKSVRSPLIGPLMNTSSYPNADDFKIIHPFYHDYNDHISIEEPGIYVKKDDRGLATINMVALNDPQFLLEKIKRENVSSKVITKSIETGSYINKTKCEGVIEKILSREGVDLVTRTTVSSEIYDEMYKHITDDILERTAMETLRKKELLKLLASNTQFNELLKTLRQNNLYLQVISFDEEDKNDLIYFIEEIAKTKKTEPSLKTDDPVKYDKARRSFSLMKQIHRKKKLLKQIKKTKIKPRLRNSTSFRKQGFEGVIRMKAVIEKYDDNEGCMNRIKAFMR